MNKHFAIIALLFLMASCQQEGVHAYHIQGTIDDAENGMVVTLQTDREENTMTLAETKVQNHRFYFDGTQDSTIECSVTYMQKGRKTGATFFLENGHINMNLSNETSVITGTPTNNHYQQFLNQINAIYTEIGRAYNDSTEDENEEMSMKMEELTRKINDLIVNTIMKNLNNAMGYHLFCRFNQNLPTSQQVQIIKRMPLRWQHTPAVEDIRSQLSTLPDSIAY